jgi:hypothetical protein
MQYYSNTAKKMHILTRATIVIGGVQCNQSTTYCAGFSNAVMAVNLSYS